MGSVSDLAIQSTCNDASSCKKYAVQKGYWTDPFINEMVKSAGTRKPPEISRGYYARTESVWILINKFIQRTDGKCQIVSLGAGLDTTFWRLRHHDNVPVKYVELDFSNVTARKVQTVRTKQRLLECISPGDADNIHYENNNGILSKDYALLPVDLRELQTVEDQLKLSNIDFSLPTLFLAECVLVYMPSTKSNDIIKWIAQKFDDCVFINYEQVNMADRFGQVMIENLQGRDCDLPGVDMCKSLETQRERFTNNGWHDATCITMWSAYSLLPQVDRQRVDRIEFMDEVELLEQLMSHYCICSAYKDTSQIGLNEIQL